MTIRPTSDRRTLVDPRLVLALKSALSEEAEARRASLVPVMSPVQRELASQRFSVATESLRDARLALDQALLEELA